MPITTPPAIINPAYAPYIGKWSCTKPAMDEGWDANLTVYPEKDGTLNFVEQMIGTAQDARPDHFYLSEDPKTEIWTESDPAEPWDRTGKLQNGVLFLAEPPPSPLRFRLDISSDGKTMIYLNFNANPVQSQVNYANDEVKCTKQSSSP